MQAIINFIANIIKIHEKIEHYLFKTQGTHACKYKVCGQKLIETFTEFSHRMIHNSLINYKLTHCEYRIQCLNAHLIRLFYIILYL